MLQKMNVQRHLLRTIGQMFGNAIFTIIIYVRQNKLVTTLSTTLNWLSEGKNGENASMKNKYVSEECIPTSVQLLRCSFARELAKKLSW